MGLSFLEDWTISWVVSEKLAGHIRGSTDEVCRIKSDEVASDSWEGCTPVIPVVSFFFHVQNHWVVHIYVLLCDFLLWQLGSFCQSVKFLWLFILVGFFFKLCVWCIWVGSIFIGDFISLNFMDLFVWRVKEGVWWKTWFLPRGRTGSSDVYNHIPSISAGNNCLWLLNRYRPVICSLCLNLSTLT